MAVTAAARTYEAALADARAFKALFPAGSYLRWEFAGSLRRKCKNVSDIEHVILPEFGQVERGDDLFKATETANLLWFHLDSLLHTPEIEKHIYGATGFRWGPLYRGADFRGFNHELFLAVPDNWGAILAIRTGPADFSKRLVTGLLKNSRRNIKGAVWDCKPCHYCDGKGCLSCYETSLLPVQQIPVPEETDYFKYCGVPWCEPEQRR